MVLMHLAHLRQKAGASHAARAIAGVHVVLITPLPYYTHTAMLPGWMAGHQGLDACHIDLQPLIQAAGVHWIQDRVISVAASHRRLQTTRHQALRYDVLSLNCSGTNDTQGLQPLEQRLLTATPSARLVTHWPTILQQAAHQPGFTLAIIGGESTAVEMALAAQHAFAQHQAQARVHLIVGHHGLLDSHSRSVQRRAKACLQHANITIHRQQAIGLQQGLLLSNGATLPVHAAIAATPVLPPDWLLTSGMQRDEQGYLVVNAAQQSVSHPHIFAAGTICRRKDLAPNNERPHAINTPGRVLANNLHATLVDSPLRAWIPRTSAPTWLTCGGQQAIVSWGMWSAQGRWLWQWQQRHHHRWIQQRTPAPMPTPAPTAVASEAPPAPATPPAAHSSTPPKA